MDSRIRHIAKSITWRVIATSTTVGVALFVQNKQEDALPTFGILAFFDVVLKLLIYYFHERFWFNLNIQWDHKVRHVVKAFSWRIIASLTTFIIVIILFRDQENTIEKGLLIAVFEFFLKMIFYYGHEEAWYRIHLGLDNRAAKKSAK